MIHRLLKKLFFVILLIGLAGCGRGITPDDEVDKNTIFLSIIWHQHQPVYFKDPETGVYQKPWVRLHATKDYVDMASILKQYPDLKVTFNLTPSLIRQLDDFEAGAKDLYWVMAEKSADFLTKEDKKFIIDRFFDINPKIIDRFPRYVELRDIRAKSKTNPPVEYGVDEYRDLQILFNLAWVDPDWLEDEPLASLVEKGSMFSEEDKGILFNEHKRLISQVIPIHKELQEKGQIEITMTPFAHPILPLLVNTEQAKEALPDIELPSEAFKYGQDAVEQVRLGVELYKDHFDQAPRGMWPAEGSVGQIMVSMVNKNGILWMASDEGVLANSLGMEGFTRDANEVVSQPEILYRPYYVKGGQGGSVAIVFRDVMISDKVGFTYSGMKGKKAAEDFVGRVHAIRDKLIAQDAEGPFLVSVILDGENAWEYYDNDGKEFLHSLYTLLSEDEAIKTITPSEFIAIAPQQPNLENLWAGSWINHDFSTWIGEKEENTAWGYLLTTRRFLQEYIAGTSEAPNPEALDTAKIHMYIAEGSDWFWWYGADQNSGSDDDFDRQFRETLKQVYVSLRVEPPKLLDVPIIPERPVEPDTPATGLITPEIDGKFSSGEWEGAGVYLYNSDETPRDLSFFESLSYGLDSKNLYLKVNTNPTSEYAKRTTTLEIYLSTPSLDSAGGFSRSGTLLGFPSNRMVELHLDDGVISGGGVYKFNQDNWELSEFILDQFARGDDLVEIAVPLPYLGSPDAGARLNLKVYQSSLDQENDQKVRRDVDHIPVGGPALIAIPDLGTTTVILDVVDPVNDDHGPGNYTYPKDSVFASGNFDITNFQVGYDEKNYVFKFVMGGPVNNVWGSPNGLSVQTFDIYLDTDGDEVGGKALLPGRNLAVSEGFAWDYAITIEGWESKVFIPADEGPEAIASTNEFVVLVDPGQRKITVRIPKEILGPGIENWKIIALTLGQEGFPSSGVMRVRDVNPISEQWRFGGATEGITNHTRVIDLVWHIAGDQESWLSDFLTSDESQISLTQDDFADIPMIPITK